MTPKANSTIREIFTLLDSVQAQLQQIRERARDLIEGDTTKNQEEESSDGK